MSKEVLNPKLGFVIPWFGFDIPGGAESYCRDLAVRLAAKGYSVEILTTCARELASNWNQNHHRPGTSEERGLTIHRFPVKPGDHFVFNSLNQRLLLGGSLSPEEESAFIDNIINSTQLNNYIAAHKDRYLYFLIPYMFGTTYWGARAADDRAVLIPCLHDEPYARLEIMRETFERVPAVLFNSEPEARLANKLYDLSTCRQLVLGIGVDPAAEELAACPVEPPFLLYLGRKDSGKGTNLLIEYFRLFKRRSVSDLKLVLAGSGQVKLAEGCVDLGFVTASAKRSLLKEAVALCQPSTNESFSKVIMEAWLEGTPVLVHGSCDVTREHVEQSRGGLYFRDYFEFEACLEFLVDHPEQSPRLAENGMEYVLRHYSWDSVLQRFDHWFREISTLCQRHQ